MIAPEKKKENEDEHDRIGDVILEILEVYDSESEEFKQKISEIYRRLYKKIDFSEALYQNSPFIAKSDRKASVILEFGLTVFPEHSELLEYYCTFLVQRQNYLNAIPCLRRLVELEPRSSHAWYLLGHCIVEVDKRGNEDLGDLEECFKKAVELDESCQDAWLELGQFYKRNGRFEKALPCLEKLLALDENDDFAQFLLGHIHQKLGNGDLAIDCYQKSLDLDPTHDIVWNNLGSERARRFEFEEAIKMYLRALQFNPDSEVTWENLRFAYIGTEQFEKADYCEKKARRLEKYHSSIGRKETELKKEKECHYYT